MSFCNDHARSAAAPLVYRTMSIGGSSIGRRRPRRAISRVRSLGAASARRRWAGRPLRRRRTAHPLRATAGRRSRRWPPNPWPSARARARISSSPPRRSVSRCV